MLSIRRILLAFALLAALVVLCIPRNYRFVIRLVTLGATFAAMLLALALFVKTDYANAGVPMLRCTVTPAPSDTARAGTTWRTLRGE